ncbi:MAG TPA: ABC transporter permease [Candidatus Sulfotelmatobacter sp.]|nr:ABC transporter permease [Candidatus Sulfotelmatobacter sp.]
MQTLWPDIRHSLRLLRLNPGFTTVAILSLALGIGANTAIFQLLDAVRLRTLPVKEPQQLAIVRIGNRTWSAGHHEGRYSELTNPQWEQIRDHQEGFSSIFAWAASTFNLAESGEARYAEGIYVSGDFFKALEVQPLLGRLFTADDDRRGCGLPAAVVSYGFWQKEFGGQPSALGSKLTLEGHPVEIVGITPPAFFGVEIGRNFDVAVPLCSEPVLRGEGTLLDMRHGYWIAVMGRLKPGWTIERATAQLNAVSVQMLEATVPQVYKPDNVKKYMQYKFAAFPASNGFSSLRQEYENPLWILLAIAALVLLIACANLANLMLARASAREREVGVRLAMGASRARLLRQMLVESLTLAVIGAVLGASLAQALSRFLVAFLSTEGSTIFMDLHADWRVFGFTAALAIFTCVLFGLTPALRSTRISPASVLKSAAKAMTAGRERFGLRRLLVVSQIALSLVLLVGSLLFVRTLRNLLTLDPGFRQDGVIISNLNLTHLNIAKENRQLYKRDLLKRVNALPGIVGAVGVGIVPIAGDSWNENVFIAGDQKRQATPWFNRVSPNYFKTMKTPFLAGRDFDEHDTETAPRVAIVNETFVRKFLNVGENPVGLTFRQDGFVGSKAETFQIVGYVKDSKYSDLREQPRPLVFLTSAQDPTPDNNPSFLVRASVPPSVAIPEIRDAILQAGPETITEFKTLQTEIRDSLLRERLMATLSGFFGFLAVVLATIGLYGVISYTVARRTNEIGIRVALGAQRGHVLGMIMREAGAMLVVGLGAGAILALVAARAAGSLLYGLKPGDPFTLTLAIVGLSLVAGAASFLPAHRAAGLDPMQALREE